MNIQIKTKTVDESPSTRAATRDLSPGPSASRGSPNRKSSVSPAGSASKRVLRSSTLSARPRSPCEQCEDPKKITSELEPIQVGVSDKPEDESESSESAQEELSQSDIEEEFSKLKGTNCGLNNLLNIYLLLRLEGLIKGSSTKYKQGRGHW